jgi:hypothetical protein
VAEQLLDGSNIFAFFEEMSGEAMSQSMAANLFLDAGGEGALSECPLDAGFVAMVSSEGTVGIARIDAPFGAGKEILPF